MARRFTSEELRRAIEDQLDGDAKSGVPLYDTVYVLARWVEGIIDMELERAEERHAQVRTNATHQG